MSKRTVSEDNLTATPEYPLGVTPPDGLDGLVRTMIHRFTSRGNYFDGTPINEEIRNVWRQGAYLQAHQALNDLIEPLVRRAVQRAWRHDVEPEFIPWKSSGVVRQRHVTLADHNLAEVQDHRSQSVEQHVELATAWESALSRLTPQQRAVVALHYESAQSFSEIAETVGVSLRTVQRICRKFADDVQQELGIDVASAGVANPGS